MEEHHNCKGSPTEKITPVFGHCPFSNCTPPRTQTGTLGHFISEKSAPNHPGKGLDPPKMKEILPKKVAPNHPGKGLDPPPQTGNAQMPGEIFSVGLPLEQRQGQSTREAFAKQQQEKQRFQRKRPVEVNQKRRKQR